MTPPEHFLSILGIVLLFGLLLPQLLKRLHLPFATSLILVGSLLGPHGLAYVEQDESLVLFGFLGAMFQMLLAGIEARLLGGVESLRPVSRLALLNGVVPAAIGVGVARSVGYGWLPALFVGIVFLSSSVMLVFSLLESTGIARSHAGRLIKAVVVLEDLGASVLAYLLFQAYQPHLRFPLPILAGLLVSSAIVLRMFLPEIVAFAFRRLGADGDPHEARLRLVISLLLLVIFGYSTLDVHPVIAAFLVGFALAEVPEVPELKTRLESLGFGLFIPVFLFIVGLDTDLSILWTIDPRNALVVALLVAAVSSKLVGGWVGARWIGIEAREARSIAIASTVKLAVPLSATYAARDLGLLDAELFSAIVILSVATSMIVPLVLTAMHRAPEQEAE